jgi:cation:H+ antiporter
MLTYILFFIGFVLLIKGADLLVDGASSLAGKFGISAMVIGLTIVAFGTSTPELVVNLLASLQGSTELAIGNILGSNIANILLILGISAIFYPLAVQKSTTWKEIPFALLAAAVLAVMANDVIFDGATSSVVSKIDGFMLLSFFVIFLYYVYGLAKKDPNSIIQEVAVVEGKNSTLKDSVMVFLGIAGLTIGGKWIVDGAIAFASSFGVSEALIGLTIVAIGTSLPEMATSVVAAYKKKADIAVGNIIGSNIFNIFWILGLSSMINPLPFSQDLNIDLLVVLGATFVLFLTMFVGKKHTIERSQGVVFVLLYIAYIIYLVVRG